MTYGEIEYIRDVMRMVTDRIDAMEEPEKKRLWEDEGFAIGCLGVQIAWLFNPILAPDADEGFLEEFLDGP